MISIKQLLSEKVSGKLIYEAEFKELVTTKYRLAFWLFHNDILFYRGQKSYGHKYFEARPSKGERESVDGGNIYTVLLGYLPSWRNFPKRSHSLIMTNNTNDAFGYGGSLVYVFPENESKIAVSGYPDVLSDKAFPYMHNGYGVEISFINNLDDLLEAISSHNPTQHTSKYSMGNPAFLRSADYKTFIDDLNAHTNPKSILDLIKKLWTDPERKNKTYGGWASNRQERILKTLIVFVRTKDVHGWNWEKFLDYILDPKKNKFELLSLEDFKTKGMSSGRHEMWTDGDCLMVDSHAYDEVYKIADQVFKHKNEPN